MLGYVRAVARFFQTKIGWNRIGFLLSITIIAVALYVLVHMLRDLDTAQVIAALEAVDWHRIALAALFVAGGYFTLTFYDWFALRTIEHPEIPYRIAALSGFTSYAVGHNIGATVFTGGAVRYRIYSLYGLTAVDVAKICFVAGLTFWLGNAAVLGLSVLIEPHAAAPITQLPGWLNRTIAAAILAVLFSYLAWVWSAPREIGRGEWTVRLPSGPSTLLQICIGILDLGCCAMAMYMLLPSEPNIGFITLLVVFVSATLLGFASWGTFRAFPANKYTVEHSVYVHRDQRGRGLGERLLLEVIRRARERQIHVLVGCIDAANSGSIALHTKLGFTHAGTIKEAGFKFGRWLDAAFYQLNLEMPAPPVDG